MPRGGRRDYLLGVAALDGNPATTRRSALERVLARPQHAGAQMDIARAYYSAGSFGLAEASFLKLRASNPPPAAQQAIGRYLEAIESRKRQTSGGWNGYGELGLGYDSNLTGVPANFGAAAQQSFNLIGIEATGNSIKRSAAFMQGAIGAGYSKPLSRGWSVFGNADLKGRAYQEESDFNSVGAEFRFGGALNSGPNQWMATGQYLMLDQEGDAPGDETHQRPPHGRPGAGLAPRARHQAPARALAAGQRGAVPEERDRGLRPGLRRGLLAQASSGRASRCCTLTAFGSHDKAMNKFSDG
jgi:hypothetical protein